jgi:PAS domain S-box-containing protein
MSKNLPPHSVSELRCKKCDKLLARGNEGQDLIEIKCVRCGAFNALLEKMQEQVIITDPDGVILYANETVEKATGFSSHEIIGARPSLWGKQMSSVFYKELWNVIQKKKESLVTEVTNKHKDGTLYNAELSISPILDTNGNVRFYVGIEKTIISERNTNDEYGKD